MRISKDLAKQIAERLLEKKAEGISKAQDALRKFTNEIVPTKIPDEVKQFAKRFPEYFEFSTSVRFCCKETNRSTYKWNSVDDSFVDKSEGSYMAITKSEYNEYEKLSDKIEKLKSDYNRSLQDVKAAIFNLRTDAKLREHFPEAAALIPKGNTTTALAVNIDSIRELLK